MPHTNETSFEIKHAMHRAVGKSRSPGKAKDRSSKEGTGSDATGGVISADDRKRMIATAAYYRAARRNFAPGCELEDWCAAEAETDGRLKRD